MEELKRFENDLNASKELRKIMDETVLKLQKEGKHHSDGELVAAAAQELGYNISIAALEKAKAEAEQLDPAEMEYVSGGSVCGSDYKTSIEDEYGHDHWCWTAWHCYGVTLHTETESHYASCWSSYMCVLAYKKEA